MLPSTNFTLPILECFVILKAPPFHVLESDSNDAIDAVHKYPSSSHMYKNWDRLAKQIQEEEKSENLEGDAALNKLFQQKSMITCNQEIFIENWIMSRDHCLIYFLVLITLSRNNNNLNNDTRYFLQMPN